MLHVAGIDANIAASPWSFVVGVGCDDAFHTFVFGSHAVVIAFESRQHFVLVDQREILQRFDVLRIANSRLRTIHVDNPHRIARKTELTGRILENAIRADWTALDGHISIFVNFSFRLCHR
ncbi:hypothetical protein [Pseudomonas phage BL1]|nr:hypothetical protein [Pseudomonas phage BL1]